MDLSNAKQKKYYGFFDENIQIFVETEILKHLAMALTI
jgi:hypothetical protein